MAIVKGDYQNVEKHVQAGAQSDHVKCWIYFYLLCWNEQTFNQRAQFETINTLLLTVYYKRGWLLTCLKKKRKSQHTCSSWICADSEITGYVVIVTDVANNFGFLPDRKNHFIFLLHEFLKKVYWTTWIVTRLSQVVRHVSQPLLWIKMFNLENFTVIEMFTKTSFERKSSLKMFLFNLLANKYVWIRRIAFFMQPSGGSLAFIPFFSVSYL